MPARKKTTRKPAARRKTTRKAPAARKSTPSARGGLRLRTATPSFTVDSLDKSLKWYRDVLGCTVKERWEHEGKLMGVELAAGDIGFYIGQDDWKKGRNRAKGEGFRLYCETRQDIDRLAEQIKARGGRLSEKPHDMSWGGRSLTVEDPDGFKISISKG